MRKKNYYKQTEYFWCYARTVNRLTSVTTKRNHVLQICISGNCSLVKQPSCSAAALARMISFLKKDHSYLTWPWRLPKRANPGPKFLLPHQLAHNWSLTLQWLYHLLVLSSVHFNFAFSQIFCLLIFGSLLDTVKSKPKHPINAALIIPKILLKPLHIYKRKYLPGVSKTE